MHPYDGSLEHPGVARRDPVSQALYVACQSDDLPAVLSLLRQGANVNFRDTYSFTPLHIACANGHERIVQTLLRVPGIEVNPVTSDQATPFIKAFITNRAEVLKVMVLDSRVDVNWNMSKNTSPAFWAAEQGFLRPLKFLLASGRKLKWTSGDTRSLEQAILRRAVGKRVALQTEIFELVQDWKSDPEETAVKVRQDIGFSEYLAGIYFSIMVFTSDGHLRLREELLQQQQQGSEPELAVQSTIRYFAISQRLPMEMQMVLSNRTHRVSRDLVASVNVERGLRFSAALFQ